MPQLRPATALLFLAPCLAGCGSDATSPGPDTSSGGTSLASLQIEVVTLGSTRDRTGYSLALDGAAARPSQPTDTLRFDSLSPGPHQVTMAGVALNCRPSLPPTATLQLRRGMNQALLRVVCDSALSDVLVLSSNLASPGQPLVVIRPTDGASLGSLTQGPAAFDRRAVVSPDGRFVALARVTRDTATSTVATMQVMRLRVADGSVTPLTEAVPWIDRLAWTPDGQEVLATGDFPAGYGAYRIPAAGGTPVRLPLDGLGYTATTCANGQMLTTGFEAIDRLSAAGTLLDSWSSLTIDDPQSPACSRDATQVAFEARPGGRDISPYPSAIYLVRTGSVALEQLTPTGPQAQDPTFSPTGDRLAFTSLVGADWNTDVLYLEGQKKGLRYTVHGNGYEPDWAPDLDPDGTGQP